MTVVCYACKKEVRLVSFGRGFVGTCCDSVLYNSAIKPKLDMKIGGQDNLSAHSSRQERRYSHEKLA